VSRQVSIYYVLPGLPGLSIVVALLVCGAARHHPQRVKIALTILTWIALTLAAVAPLGKHLYLSSPVGILPTCLSTLLLVVVYLTYSSASHKDYALPVRLGSTALSIVTAYAIVTLHEFATIDEGNSAESVISFAEKVPGITSVSFFEKVPQSAYFYSQDGKNDHLRVLKSDGLVAAPQGLLVVSAKKWRKRSPAERDSISVIAELNGWVVTTGLKRVL
jgi:hypothetical protein